MEILETAHPYYLLVRNFYTPDELELIQQELAFLNHKHKMRSPESTGQQNPMMKKNKGIFLDEVYANRGMSNILKINRKVFSAPVFKAFADKHILNRSVFSANKDTTLVSYYETSDHYKPHADNALVTALSWHFFQPQQFTGGDLVFTDLDETILVENNMLLMFHSCLRHGVTPVKLRDGVEADKGMGRYCLSNFMNIS